MYVNLKPFIALPFNNIPVDLYFVLKYFSFTLPHTSLIATHLYNNTMHSVPSMTFQPFWTVFLIFANY